MPASADEWRKIAKDFEERWQFPHCLGAIVGKHVWIVPPPDSGSFYFNYKGFHSIVLMACANANYEFILAEVGANGHVSDGGAIKCTPFYRNLEDGQLGLPSPAVSESGQSELPYVFVGDEAFALRPDFMKPYSQKTLNPSRTTYNKRLSRARRIIENVFGIMSQRFCIFQTLIHLSMDRPGGVDMLHTPQLFEKEL